MPFFDRWFAVNEDNGQIRRRLTLLSSASETTSYRVTVVTSDLRGAGTDANVSIVLFGEKGKETKRCVPVSPLLFIFVWFMLTKL